MNIFNLKLNLFSIEFLILFLIFFIIYNKSNLKIQNILLLAFSLFFIYKINLYCFIVLIIFTFFIHFFALSIYTRNSKNIFLTIIFAVVLNLAFFKSYQYIKDSLDYFFTLINLEGFSEIFFPVGLSYYTFNSITYLVYIYKNKERPVGYFYLLSYFSFFAIFLSGPIFEFKDFKKQFDNLKRFKHLNLVLSNILFALVKMLFLLPFIDKLFIDYANDIDNLGILGLLNYFYLYSIKLYLDFSAYVNLVSAIALILGIKLPRNFNNPFKAKNIQDFWRRWHMSLSNFIKNYIYIPLGGRTKNIIRHYFNIFCAFSLSGLWHGVELNFLVWGLLHACGLIFINIFKFNMKPILSSFINFTYISLIWSFFFLTFDNAINTLSLFINNKNISIQEIYLFTTIVVLFIINFYSKNHLALLVIFLRKLDLITKIIFINIVLLIVFIYMPNGIPNFIYIGF
ncbi:MBOAT family O-acyltransferase [Campylobacter sp. MG1]|uniref:MBOAT family O-acyltransferase n=1 Tax=Campylobacter sp. MG1 TaxID=2976332 RepID=UPI00226D11B7|nr:MBOAT family O-acyltransferase [Campylobacter sp. MG1]